MDYKEKYCCGLTDIRKKALDKEDSITKRHKLLINYLSSKIIDTENIIANDIDDDIDFEEVTISLLEDLLLIKKHLIYTTERVEKYQELCG